MADAELEKYYKDWNIPPCFQFNEAELDLNYFYNYCATEEDLAEGSQWWMEEAELSTKAPLYFAKVNMMAVCERLKEEQDAKVYELSKEALEIMPRKL